MDEGIRAAILRDAIEQALEDLDEHCRRHQVNDCPVRDETIRKLEAALRLLEE